MPILKLDGEAGGAVKAVEDVGRAVKATTQETQKMGYSVEESSKKWRERLKELGKQHDEAAASAKKLGDAAAKIVRDNEGPQQRYNRLLRELKTHMDAGRLSQDQATTAAARYRTEIFGATGFTTAWGNATSQLRSNFLSFFGPGAILAGAIGALRAYRAELDGAMQMGQGGVHGLGQLTELAMLEKNPREAMREMTKEAIGFYESGAVKSPEEGSKLEFMLHSAQVKSAKDRQLVATLAKYGVLQDPMGFAAGLSALQSSYPEATTQEIFGRGIVAASIAPTNANMMIANAAKAAAQGKVVGSSDAATLAMMGILTRKQGSPEEAQTRVNRFFVGLEKTGYKNMPELKGKNILDVVDQMAAGGMERSNITKYVGNELRGIQAARALIEQRQLLRQVTKTASGDTSGFAEQAIDLARETPEIENAVQRTRGENIRGTQLYRSMGPVQLYEAAVDRMVAARRERGDSEIMTRWLLAKKGIIEATEGTGPSMWGPGIRNRLIQGLNSGDINDPELKDAILRMVRSMESVDRKTRDVVPSGRQQ